MAKRKNKKNKQKNKFKTTPKQSFSQVSSSDVNSIAYKVFGALTYSSEKTS